LIDAVLAGSQVFTDALGLRVGSRLGSPPRVADDPHQAFSLCAERGGLLVMEYGGPEWIPVVRDLRSLCGEGIAVVVAVAPSRSAAVAGLQHAGADEVVEWDGRADAVAWAVERLLVARGERLATPVPVPAAPPVAVTNFGTGPTILGPESPPVLQRATSGPGPAPARPVAPAAAFTIREAPPAAGPAPGAPPAWPAGVPGGPEAEQLLATALASGAAIEGEEAEVARRVLAGLTAGERDALRDAATTEGHQLLRRSAGLRLRVALALARPPAPGSPYDEAAVHSLLAELDSELQALTSAGQEERRPELQLALDTVRGALVTEALQLTDVVQKIAPAGQPVPAAPALAARPAVGQLTTRLLSMQKGEQVRRPVPVGSLVFLVLVLAAAVGYHVNERLNRPVAPTFHYPGAPHDTVAAPGRPGEPVVIVKQRGRVFDAEEVERLRAQEELRGRTVQQLAPGTLVVLPAKPKDARPSAGTQGGTP
jgi:hypothetical protein